MAESTAFISMGIKSQLQVTQHIEKVPLQQNKVVVANEASETTQELLSCGRAWLDEKIIIVDPKSLTKCPDDRVGEVWVSSPSVGKGYWLRKQATEETFQAYPSFITLGRGKIEIPIIQLTENRIGEVIDYPLKLQEALI